MNRLWVTLVLCLLSLVSSYTLQIKVLVPPDTIAVGTNISILHEGVEIASSKAGKDGTATFEVLPGSYFVILKRGGYPTHVHLVQIDMNRNITYIMREQIAYAGIWGRIEGPKDFSNSSITLYSDSKVIARLNHKKDNIPNKDGYFLISFLPEGQYRIAFEAEGFIPKEEIQQLYLSDFAQLNVVLEQAKPQEPPKIALIVTSENKTHSLIALQLLNGSKPLEGEKIQAETPSGQIFLTTSSNGTAYLNAAEAGKYIFSYQNLSYELIIENEATEPMSESKISNDKDSLAINQTQPQQQQQEPTKENRLKSDIESNLIFALLGAGLFFAIAAFLLLLRRKQHHKKHKR
ncbi:MAG: carboxypeptidase-like regulatory domain-containing protein [Candidatus Anstonellaceae archaeon]